MDNKSIVRDISIGVLPNSVDLNHPADRRRYIPFFRDKNIKFEIADFEKSYDILIISINSDIERWSTYKAKHLNSTKCTRVIFDLSDLYLKENRVKDLFRSIYYFLIRRVTKLRFSYKKSLLKMISQTDVLICGSIEQKQYLDFLHRNVIVVRDYFEDDIKSKKNNFKISNEINILWEGLSHGNKEIFLFLKRILKEVKSIKINLHLITDPVYCEIGGKYVCKATNFIIQDLFEDTGIKCFVYPWNPLTFSSIATKCDIALLPIPDNEIMINKPENKLIFLLSHGIPTITSDTPSYKRVLNHIGVNYFCNDIEDWKSKIEHLLKAEFIRSDYIDKANDYINRNASKKIIYNTWNQILFD